MKLLEPVDLLEHIRLGQNALVGGLDADRDHVPYWSISVSAEEGLKPFSHSGAWDLCHDVSRALHALGMAERATGEPVPEIVWTHLGDMQIALFDEADDLPGTPDNETGERFVHLHNIRESTHGLIVLIRRGDARAATRSRRMVRRLLGAMDEEGTLDLDQLPPYVSTYTHQPHQEGRAVDALVRLYRATGDDAALELAGRMTRYALTHCFTEEGRVRQEAGGHGHSLNAMVAGMLDYARVTRDVSLAQRVKAIYDVGCPAFNSSFGWSMESLSKFNLRGESNNTGDLLRAALLLGRAGWVSGFEDAERILRGHLLPSQVMDVDDFPDEEAEEDARSRRASRVRGGFSFPTPNDYLLTPEATIMTYDITSGAVDGLCEAMLGAVTRDETAVWVNLLFSREGEGVRIRSDLSREGRVEIENRSGLNVMLRVPSWVSPEDLRVSVNGEEIFHRVFGDYLLIPECDGRCVAVVTFPLREVRTVEQICYTAYTIDWRGDQIVAMSPPAQHRPMFPGVTT